MQVAKLYSEEKCSGLRAGRPTGDTSYAYTILEIDKSASDAEVKKAYRTMVKKYHPDKLQHMDEVHRNGAQEKFNKVQEAYEQIQKERGI